MVGSSENKKITDLSGLSAENIKYRNTQFLMDRDLPYDIAAHESRLELRRQIWNVRNGDLRRLFYDFPLSEPLVEQCALWAHAVVGKHFFPDANHRTAIATLRRLLRKNDLPPADWPPDRVRAVRDESHQVRKEIEPVRLDTLYQRDPLYDVWRQFFGEVRIARETEQ